MPQSPEVVAVILLIGLAAALLTSLNRSKAVRVGPHDHHFVPFTRPGSADKWERCVVCDRLQLV